MLTYTLSRQGEASLYEQLYRCIREDILSGRLAGPKRDVVLLNAGCGLYIAGKAASIGEGVALAARTVDSGAAAAKLEEFIAATRG